MTVAQLVKKCRAFYVTQSPLQCLQEPATDSYPKPDGSTPHTHTLLLTVEGNVVTVLN
jgi:hypothetical protein